MAGPKPLRPKRARRQNGRGGPPESRASVAVTTAWSVTIMTLLICEVMGLFALAYLRFNPAADGVRSLLGLTFFTALVLAILSLGLLPAVYRVRPVPPPRSFVLFAGVLAAIPIFVAIWSAVQ
jgi:hypothetical protein